MKHTWICVVALGFACCGTKESEATTATPGGTSSGSGGATQTVPPGGPESHELGQGKDAQPSLTRSIEYYDGPTKRKLWISEDLVAEFEPSDAGRDAVLRADPGAKEVEQPQKGARVWRMHAATGVEGFAQEMSTATTRFSPVLHDGPAPGFPMRALPGGIVVTFPKEWDRAAIDAWGAGRNVKIESTVSEPANMFLVATPPGLASVHLANELHEMGDLVDAAPNFWMQASTR